MKNKLKQKLKEGKVVFGPWCITPSAAITDIISKSGMDFIIIDKEHGCMSFETTEDMIKSAELNGCSPIIRTSSINKVEILKSLEIGIHGILVPDVEVTYDANFIVKFSKYHPEGSRGFSPYTRAGGYSAFGIKEHTKKQNKETLVGIIIEGEMGLRNIDSILEVKGIDLVYIGAYDLSQSLGIPGDVENPIIKKKMEECIKKINDKNIAAGGYVAKNKEDIKWMKDIGMQFITCLPDVTQIYHTFYDQVQMFKEVINE